MPVHANIEAIWVVIIVISIVAQIVKAVRKAAAQAQGKGIGKGIGPGMNSQSQRRALDSVSARTGEPDGAGREFVAPEDALQEFLRSLAGENSTPPPPPPPPPPRPPRPAPMVVARPSGSKAPSRHPARIIKPPAHLPPKPVHQQVSPPVMMPKPMEAEVAPEVTLDNELQKPSVDGATVQDIKRVLHDRKTIREAILLREILGPPLALR